MASARDPATLQQLTRGHLLAAAHAWNPAKKVADFQMATERVATIDGRRFPTKAIVALAHELAGLGTLTSAQLAGAAARRLLIALGFPISDSVARRRPGQAPATMEPDAAAVEPGLLLREDVLDAIRELDANGDARRVGEDLHETAWRIPADGRWYSMLSVLEIALRRHGIVTRDQLKALLRPKAGLKQGRWRQRLAILGFRPQRGRGAGGTPPPGTPEAPGRWPAPDDLTAKRIREAAAAWHHQAKDFRVSHAAREWEVWVDGEPYPVKALCILAYLALGYAPEAIKAWTKGGRNSPWDQRIEALGFDIRPIGAPLEEQELALERFLEREDAPTEIRREAIARLTQGSFRRDLIAARRGAEQCDVTGLAISQLLRASHIHRWADCKDTPAMRKDPANGLLLAVHLDALFEHGLIAFADDGSMLLSPQLKPRDRERLQIWEGQRLAFAPTPRQCEYLRRHRDRTRAAREEDLA
ncbi:hypothetical protein BKK81_33380 (plasmid) [Cupriavidus sp. USMAHM13]|uniref:HNH endonuclease n=1 Tax=Cupriavidus sp. USMAHM13 TaxID=1389192 RepID=UPI0008A66844|nr:HNH endonuclease signature motif containing protein [Cupriavidus sp. USMAHM13]AOZ04283.1 hypothetical protein BKK81_33380 [Cupriavidus sp. USMAHM13]